MPKKKKREAKELSKVIEKFRVDPKGKSQYWLAENVYKKLCEVQPNPTKWGNILNDTKGTSGLNPFHRICHMLGRVMLWDKDFKLLLAFCLINGADVSKTPAEREHKDEKQRKRQMNFVGKTPKELKCSSGFQSGVVLAEIDHVFDAWKAADDTATRRDILDDIVGGDVKELVKKHASTTLKAFRSKHQGFFSANEDIATIPSASFEEWSQKRRDATFGIADYLEQKAGKGLDAAFSGHLLRREVLREVLDREATEKLHEIVKGNNLDGENGLRTWFEKWDSDTEEMRWRKKEAANPKSPLNRCQWNRAAIAASGAILKDWQPGTFVDRKPEKADGSLLNIFVQGKTYCALEVAMHNKNDDVAGLLLRFGASISCVDRKYEAHLNELRLRIIDDETTTTSPPTHMPDGSRYPPLPSDAAPKVPSDRNDGRPVRDSGIDETAAGSVSTGSAVATKVSGDDVEPEPLITKPFDESKYTVAKHLWVNDKGKRILTKSSSDGVCARDGCTGDEPCCVM